MNKNLFRLFLILIFAFAASVSNVFAEDAAPVAAPDFNLQSTDQDTISSAMFFTKRPVVLMFWTTWSPMSHSELSVLNTWYPILTKEGIEVLAINSGEFPDDVDAFIQDYYLAYRVLLDKDSSVTNTYKIEGFPTYILVDKEGAVVFRDNYFPSVKYKELLLNNEEGDKDS
jgi:peroxiredoxin